MGQFLSYGQGNYNFGLTEQSMFHEIDPDSIDHQRGMDKVMGLTVGGDDYVTKPFSLEEVVAPLNAPCAPYGKNGW